MLGLGRLVAGALGAASCVEALGQQAVLTFADSSAADRFQLVGGRAPAVGQILVAENEYWGVIRAAGDVAVDFGRVTGQNLTLSNGVAGAVPARYTYEAVDNLNNTVYSTTGTAFFEGPEYADPAAASTVLIAGTLGRSALVDGLVAAGKLDVTEIAGQWEAFVSTVVSEPVPGCARALVVAGSDARGTIFGLYDLSEQLGVSPLYFWADVPPRKQTAVYALAGRKAQKSPAVRFRGLFINDEQPALTDWVATHWPDSPYGAGYGAGFYALVYELLLRLRANYLWPALWGAMFEVDDPASLPLADAFEIVVGSSHTEPLMRAQNEFGTFYTGQAWQYNTNNASIDEYFRYGIQRARPYARNALWTMGMRGTGDTAIEGSLGSAAVVSMLNTLVLRQQELLRQGLDNPHLTAYGSNGSFAEVGSASAEPLPQTWCLYKEVMSYLAEGLEVPDNVTLLWSDDNWGNVRRVPRLEERRRSGGAGVYYHFDYVGDPLNYKWINTIQLAKTAEQMGLALAHGADRIWVVNVGDLKALELPLHHFLDLAYDPGRWGLVSHGSGGGGDAAVDGVTAWAEAWAEAAFGSAVAETMGRLLARFGTLASRRKFELIGPETYSVIHYGEAEAVLAQWAALVADAQAVHDSLDAAAQPAFFEMILHPVLAGDIVQRLHVAAAQNQLYAGQWRNTANQRIQTVLAASDEDVNLTLRWDSLLGGKWKHMMDQTHLGYDGYWQQPMRNSLPRLTYVQTAFGGLSGDVGVGVEGSNGSVPGNDRYHTNGGTTLVLPPLEPFGPSQRYIDVFSRGTGSVCAWTANASEPWIRLSQTSGVVGNGSVPGDQGDTRIHVSVADWTLARSTTVKIQVTTPCRHLDKYGFKPATILLPVTVRSLPASFAAGFVEADATVAVDAEHFQAIVPPESAASTSNLTYQVWRNYGRTGTGVGLWPPTTEKLSLAEAPALEYSLYLFGNSTAATTANVTLYLSPSHNYLGDDTPLEYGIALYPSGNASVSSSSPAVSPALVQPIGKSVGDKLPPGWLAAVADAVWGVTSGNQTTTTFPVQAGGGAYTLRIWALLPSIIVQKIVVDLGGVRPSYLGPPESFLVGKDRVGEYAGTNFAGV